MFENFPDFQKLLRGKIVNFNFHDGSIRKEKEKKTKLEAIRNKLDLVSTKCHSRATGI